MIRPASGGPAKPYTRASTLGGTLEDQTNLGEWKKRVVAYGLARRRDLILAAASVPTWDGLQDKKRLAEIAEQAMQHAEAGAAATIGTALHALTERLDRGEPIPDVGEDRHALEAYSKLMRHFTVHAIESFIVCDAHEVAGTFDRLMSPRFEMVAPDGTMFGPEDSLVGDIKTAATNAWFGLKFVSQLSEYSHGVPYDVENGRTEWPGGRPPSQTWGLIIHVPSGGRTAELHWVDLKAGREVSDLAVVVREWRKRKDLVTPAVPPTPPVVAELRSRIASASSYDDLKQLYAAHREHWDDDLTACAARRRMEVAS